MFQRLGVALFVGIISMTVMAPGATADPKKGALFTDTCDNGATVELVFAGGGNFTPAHVVGATTMYVTQLNHRDSCVLTSPTGEVTTEPFAVAKPNIHGDLITCTFAVDRTFSDGTTLHASGTLVAAITPRT